MAHLNRRRILYFACIPLAAVFIAAAIAWHRLSLRHHLEPDGFLTHVVQLEAVELDANSRQALGWSLAILSRDDEVRALEFHPRHDRSASSLDPDRMELHAVPWREGIEKIAADNRIVLMMEDHCASKHREFIGAALPIFKDAKFTHYAAEAIGPVDRSLAQRGYPRNLTGLYTSDPRFGNTLRRALDLKLEVLCYDFRPFTHDGREEFAATTLAALFLTSTETKLLVHAGHAHVLKHETKYGERWLAARLWEKSGIEPFTIWQWSSQRDARDYAELVRILKKRNIPLKEPVLLMPPPPMDCGLQDPPYGLARVDAIVLHPPDASVAPGMRTVLFPAEMQKLVGTWTGDLWPVVVSAYKQNEPIDAIPLDQVMLRESETQFVLWIPKDTEYQIRVFTSQGLIESRAHVRGTQISVSLGEQ